MFLALTGDMSKGEKMGVALTTSVSVFLIMGLSVFGGKYILGFFGITVEDLRVAGGILIMLMAISMVRAKEDESRHSDKEHEAAKAKDSIGVVPLAIPLMAGPASISTAIIEGATYHTLTGRIVLLAIIFGLSLVLWLAMILAEQIGRVLGYNGQKVLSRVMGLILLALSVEFITKGVKAIFHLTP